jgi:site-specific DNA-methyltransferase (adenine-specific)
MKPVLLTDRVALLCGDSKALDLGEASVDAVVCDPPYELGFMGKRWDSSGIAYDVDLWRAVYRALKPGGHLLAFGGTRTYHRMACAIEDAGFEIRDSLHWVYGSGFPKSLNVSKAIDEKLGTERPIVGQQRAQLPGGNTFAQDEWSQRHRGAGTTQTCVYLKAGQPCQGHDSGESQGPTFHAPLTAPGSPEAARWDGWGTALKPAHEPIILARRPLDGTVAGNVLAHGTGGLNVDGCRIGSTGGPPSAADSGPNFKNEVFGRGMGGLKIDPDAQLGRWPANFLLSHAEGCVVVGEREEIRNVLAASADGYDREGTVLNAGLKQERSVKATTEQVDAYRCAPGCPVGELGDPARFFYVAKPSTRERDYGCEGLPVRTGGEATDREEESAGLNSPRAGAGRKGGRRNVHPTVKPIDLMRWLCRLITPPGGTVLDPFTGSGTTGIAAIREGFNFVGVEQSAEYIEIARARITKTLEEEK